MTRSAPIGRTPVLCGQPCGRHASPDQQSSSVRLRDARRLECGQVESAGRYRAGSRAFLALLRVAGLCIIDAVVLFGT
jgi:hypothetical protein